MDTESGDMTRYKMRYVFLMVISIPSNTNVLRLLQMEELAELNLTDDEIKGGCKTWHSFSFLLLQIYI